MSKGRRSGKINEIFCGQCKLVVNEEEDDFIECDQCSKIYHVLCTKLDKRKYEHLLKHTTEEYVCHVCDSSGTLKNDLSDIKRELKKLDQLSVLHETMTFMSKQYDDILKGVAENKKKLEIVQKENKFLKAEVESLKNSVKFLNDQRVKHDCLIRGVEAKAGSSAADTILKLSSDAGVVLQPESIEDAYFIKNKNSSQNNNKKHMIVVKFNSKQSKEKLMSVKPKLKENENTKDVFVNDYLSRETLSLLNYAKALKNVGYRAVYPVGGRVFIKRSELSKPRVIRSEAEVDSLLLEASIKKPNNRRSQQAAVEDDEEANDMYLSP